MSRFKKDDEPERIKARWLVYRKDGNGVYECINHDKPFHTMEQAENFCRLCEPWQKPFMRCFFDVAFIDRNKK